MDRRAFLKTAGFAAALPILPGYSAVSKQLSVKTTDRKPNVIVVLTDDQGYGEVGYNGNPIIKTPNLDKFAEDNVIFSQFYTSPVCTPTRAALMTGRDPYRLNVPWVGHPLHTDELAMPEAFKAAGYATGCFGKWGNLGTHYPLRAVDRGFDYSVVHRKGQFSPPHNKTVYFDPILQVNGQDRQLRDTATIYGSKKLKTSSSATSTDPSSFTCQPICRTCPLRFRKSIQICTRVNLSTTRPNGYMA